MAHPLRVVLLWPEFCGNRTPSDAFWNDSWTLYTDTPRLTACFQKTVVLWVPCGWLFLTSLLYIPYLCQAPPVNRCCRSSWLNSWKLTLCASLVLLAVIDLALTISRPTTPVPPADYAEGVIRALTTMLATFLTGYAFRKGQHTSGVLLTFWFLLTLAVGLEAFSRSSGEEGDVRGTLRDVRFYVQMALTSLLLVSSVPSDLGALAEYQMSSRQSRGGEYEPLIPTKGGEATHKNACPRDEASFLNHAFLFWYWGLVVTGYQKTLTYSDMWDIRHEDSAASVHGRFQAQWNKELHKVTTRGGMPSLTWALTRAFSWKIVVATILLVLSTTTSLINPQLMSMMISFVQSGSPYTWQGYLLAVILFVMSVMGCVIMQQCYNLACHCGIHLKTAVTTAVYRKALRISSSARKSVTIGEVVNLMSVDAERLSDSVMFIHFLWVTPFTVAVTIFFLYQKLGLSSLAGLAYLITIIPLNSYLLGRFTKKYQKIQMKYKDLRLKLMSQILVGIKVLKLYAWEPYFEGKVTAIREEELRVITKSAFVITLSYIVSFSSNLVTALLCFFTYTMLSSDNVLTPDVAFVSISLFSVLSTLIMYVPSALMFLMQGMVAIERIQKFLLQPEIDPNNVQRDYNKEGAVNISNGTFSWGEADRIPLTDINLVVPEGSLVAVVGTVGAGKSSLLQAVLGEMDKVAGTVNVKGSVAYVPQQAWIQNLTVRENILFDKAYVRHRYEEVLEACSLPLDLKVLPGGDLTEIGERGINLSGGQKQRVSLARAIYQNADVYLLDDPLSAVDAHVGRHIFDNVIGPKGQLAHTTRLFVTNAITYLHHVDRIVVLRDGQVSETGTFEELVSRHDGDFSKFIVQFSPEQADLDAMGGEERELLRQLSEGDATNLSTPNPLPRRRQVKVTAKAKVNQTPEVKETNQALVTEETAQEGTVHASVVMAYIRACSFFWMFWMLIGLLVTVSANVGSSIWLSAWSVDALVTSASRLVTSVSVRLAVYGALGILQMVGTFVLVGAVAKGAVRAARILHQTLLRNSLKSPMSFFETTPTGRILNRYSKDVDVVDTNMRYYMQNLVSNLSVILSTLTVIVYSTPLFTAVFVPLVIVFIVIQRVYVKTARQVKRIDSIKRSPIYANFSETLNGVASIRAFGQEERFIAQSNQLLNDSIKIGYSVKVSDRWIGIWLEMLGDLIVLFASIFAVLQRRSLDPGTVGLSLSYALQVSWQIVLMVRYSCELETYIVAVERIKEYSEVTPEAPWELDYRPHRNWPQEGAVKFQDYRTRYRPDLDLVLSGVTCDIKAGEKIGVVGRTGAGKSSMTLALFRIIEPAGGAIYIDGEDISALGLHNLRTKLTIIPQDPVLFSGSVRFNLDPADHYADSEIWTALQQAHLQAFIAGLPGGLLYEAGEDGDNFSVGQRQLVCLARALLRRSRVLIMDEATAAVDLETDELIQATIRDAFRDSTVISIAHRLNSIMDSDRVLLLDRGVVVEFESPHRLLQDSHSAFHRMAVDAGLV